VVKDDIHLTLISEQVNQVRYTAEIRFHKAATLEILEAENLIAEVVGVGAGGGGGGSQSTSASASSQPAAARAAPAYTAPPVAAPQPATADTAPAPIAPPPPPPDQPVAAPPTISPGMTIDQVVAALGQPARIANLGSKKIYMYPNLKVIFIDGKVAPEDSDDSSGSQPGSGPSTLYYALGLGALILAAAGYLFLRSRRPAAMVPAGPPPPMPQYQAPPPAAPVAPAPPMNLIQRLDELEKLKERGILTPEEFEREKAKLRSM